MGNHLPNVHLTSSGRFPGADEKLVMDLERAGRRDDTQLWPTNHEDPDQRLRSERHFSDRIMTW